jgi:hypothetical protein
MFCKKGFTVPVCVCTNLRKREEWAYKNKTPKRSGSFRGFNIKRGVDVYSAVAGIIDTKDLLFAFFLYTTLPSTRAKRV